MHDRKEIPEMAKQLSLPPHGNTVYPWDKWENGEVHIATKGKQFRCGVPTFRSMLANRAAAKGMRVTTRCKGDTVTFRFIRPEGDSAPGKQ